MTPTLSTSGKRIILASASPRRQQLLKEAGVRFEVNPKNIVEDYPSHLNPEHIAEFLARKKAEAFKDEIQEEIVITADTVVLINGSILEKPQDAAHAFHMLKTLSGNMHRVITGVCIYTKDNLTSFSEVTEVYFRDLKDEEIHFYVEQFKPFDKAGAYGIQEWIGLTGITKINGSYFNVMGLPVHRVYEALQEF